MGGCISLRSSSSTVADEKIRVVHLSGHVQHFLHPITVRHVTGKPPEHFLCTAAQLVSAASAPALNPDAVLQPGKVYFMLPFSTLQPDVSPMDLASIARRLTAAAKCAGKTPPPPPSSGPRWNSPAAGQSSQTWKPLLDTIKERPLNQRINKSDLQAKTKSLRVINE